MNNKKNRKGFTIVELVIVIAVIAILATVLVPTFGNVISNAKNSALLQDAKNGYTEYVMKATEEEADFTDDCYIQLDNKNFYEIKDGSVVTDSEGKVNAASVSGEKAAGYCTVCDQLLTYAKAAEAQTATWSGHTEDCANSK